MYTVVYMIMHYSWFITFLPICYRPYSSWKFLMFWYTSLLAFLQIRIIVWQTHAYRINGVAHPRLSIIMKFPLCIFVSYVKSVIHSKTNQELSDSTSVNKSSLYGKIRKCVPQLKVLPPSIIVWKVKCPLRFVVSYVQPVTQQCKSGINILLVCWPSLP